MPLIEFESIENEPDIVRLILTNQQDKLLPLINADNANALANNGCSILALAADRGNLELVTLLVKHAAICDALFDTDKWKKMTVLMFAAASGNLELVAYLLAIKEFAVMIDHENKDKLTALNFAALYGHKAIVDLLLERGANNTIETWRSSTNATLLMWAVIYGQFSGVQYLLNFSGLKKLINHANQISAQTALTLAVEWGFHEIALYLKREGATTDVEAWENEFGSNLLMIAALNGATQGVNYMLSPLSGFNFKQRINYKNREGYTAITLAAIAGYAEIVDILKGEGADTQLMHWRNAANSTLLMISAMHGWIRGIQYLLQIPEFRSLINAKNRYELSAPYVAAIHGHGSVVQMLEKAGAAETSANFHRWRDASDNTLLIKAASSGLLSGLKYLLQFPNMRDLTNHTNVDGLTALELTPLAHYPTIKPLLLQNATAKTEEQLENHFKLKKEILPFFEKFASNRIASIITSYSIETNHRVQFVF